MQNSINTLLTWNLLLLLAFTWAELVFPKKKIFPTINLWGMLSAVFLYSTILGVRWVEFGYFPLTNLYESLIFLALGIILLSLVIENCFNVRFVGCISVPITVFITGFANFYLPKEMQLAVPITAALKSNWLAMHVTVMLFSYASLILGSLLGILFLLFTNNKRINEIYNYYELEENDEKKVEMSPHGENTTFNDEVDPDSENPVLDFQINLLEGIDQLSYGLIGFGFPLLTIGVISGALWANEAWGQYWCWDPKEVWSLITWIIFAAYLHSRFINTWKGRKPAIIASFGFVAIWICYFGVNFLGLGLHTYGQL